MTVMDQNSSHNPLADGIERKRKKGQKKHKERKKHKSDSHSHSHSHDPALITTGEKENEHKKKKKDKKDKKEKKDKKDKKDKKETKEKKSKKRKRETETFKSGKEDAIETGPPSQAEAKPSTSSSSSATEDELEKTSTKKKLHGANRIHIRKHADMEETEKKSTLRFYRREVSNDFFISDSDSDSDDEGYTGKLHPWHERFQMDATQRAKKNNWPISTARFNEPERVRLEKRVKKLARKRGMDLEGFRQQVMDAQPGDNITFWQDVARVFPDRTLFQIIRHAQRVYSPRQAYNVDWTPELDAELKRLVVMHGSKFAFISKQMDIATGACRERYRNLMALEKLQQNGNAKWTDDDTEKLLDSIRKHIAKSPKDIPWQDVSKDFDGKWPLYKLIQRFKLEALRVGNRLIPTVKKMDLALQVKMLDKLRNATQWNHESEIDFASLQNEDLPVSAMVMKFTYVGMRNTVPGYKTKKFHDTVETLYQRKLAMLKSYEEFGI